MTDAEAQPGCFKAWWKRITPTGPILLTAVSGILLVGLVVFGNSFVCDKGWQEGWCTTVAARPPWTLLSGLAAAPSLLLLWIWRTKHRVEDIDIAQQSQITERFVSAVQLLSDDKTASRLGGIYSLERIAEDETKSYKVVTETLAAFVRDSSSLPEADKPGTRVDYVLATGATPRPEADVQAAITVLGRMTPLPKVAGYDLSYSDLGLVNLEGANFRGVNLQCAELTRASLARACLIDANLIGARLSHADLMKADLEDAKLMNTHLCKAILTQTNLDRANLTDARIEDTNLAQSLNLVPRQVCIASGNSKTQLPEGIKGPARWK